MADYKDKSYFVDFEDRILGVFNKIGPAPWTEPAIHNKGMALSAEEVHDNFQRLTAGELNLNLRTTDLEETIVESSQDVIGSLKYNGHQEAEGFLYGGRPYELLAASDMAVDPINLSAPPAKFYIAEGLGIKYLDENNQVDNDNTVWHPIDVSFNNNKSLLPAYLNSKLINNGSEFAFLGVDLTGNIAAVCNWGVTGANFDISFNDEPFQTVSLAVSYGTVATAAAYIQNQILAKFPQYSGAFSVTDSTNRIKLTALSNIAGNRLTRVRIKENSGQTILSASGIGWIVASSYIYDFSNSLQFYLSGDKMGVRGLGSYFNAVIKDDATNPLFPTLMLNTFIKSVAPFYRLTHTAYPDASMTLPVSFGGHVHVANITSSGNIVGPIDSALANIDVLNVATLNASAVSIPNADLTLQDLIADSVTTPNATISTLLDATNATMDAATIQNLTAPLADIGDLTAGTIHATDAVVSNLTVSGGSINTASVTAGSISSSAGAFSSASVGDLIITKASRAAGRLYTTPINSISSVDPPSSTNAQALLLSYDGWFRATKVHAGSVEVTSLRALKKDITPYTESALDIINSTDIVNYKYISDTNEVPRVGFIADDTHSLLATPEHNALDMNNAIGLLLKAVQELSKENQELKARLDAL